MTFLTLLQSRAAPGPIFPITSPPSSGGGGGGGWGGNQLARLRAFADDATHFDPTDEINRPPATITMLARALGTPAPTTPTPSTAKVAGISALVGGTIAVLKGVGDVASEKKRKKKRNPQLGDPQLDSLDFEAPRARGERGAPSTQARTDTRAREVPLDQLPIGKGRAALLEGKPCLICREKYRFDYFPFNARGVRGRICANCVENELSRSYVRTCEVCGIKFKTASSRACLCSPECVAERRDVYREIRQKKAKRAKKEAIRGPKRLKTQ